MGLEKPQRILAHCFYMGDVEDPELYAAEPILKWERTEQGQWLHAHSKEQLSFTIGPSPESYGWKCNIWAVLDSMDLTYYTLKWGNKNVFLR